MDSKQSVDASFLHDNASVTTAVLRGMIRGTKYS
jgi:hypothetical protein